MSHTEELIELECALDVVNSEVFSLKEELAENPRADRKSIILRIAELRCHENRLSQEIATVRATLESMHLGSQFSAV